MNTYNVKTCNKLTEELQKNMAVVVGFTIGGYPFKNNKSYSFKTKIVKQALSLNLQFVIALAGPAKPAHVNDNAPISAAYCVGPPLNYDSDEDNADSPDRFEEDAVQWI